MVRSAGRAGSSSRFISLRPNAASSARLSSRSLVNALAAIDCVSETSPVKPGHALSSRAVQDTPRISPWPRARIAGFRSPPGPMSSAASSWRWSFARG